MTGEQLNRQLKAFNRGLLIRKWIGVFAAIVTIKIFVASLFFSRDVLLNLGLGLLAAWVGVVAVTLWTSAARSDDPQDACTDYFRALLAGERAYIASGTIWGPLAVTPIAALVLWRIWVLVPAEYRTVALAAEAVCLAGAVIKIAVFRWQMRRLDKKISHLDPYF